LNASEEKRRQIDLAVGSRNGNMVEEEKKEGLIG